MAKRVRIKTGDNVMVIAGRDKGKRGSVLKMLRKADRAIVQGVNMVKRHAQPSRDAPSGGIIQKEASIHLSNISLIDPKSDRPTRVGVKVVGERKVRFARRSGEMIDA